MGTISNKLNRLQQTKSAIKSSLEAMGVSVDADTIFFDYAALIRRIQVGDLTREVFLAELKDPSVSYGFYLPNESAGLSDVIDLLGMNRITSVSITITTQEDGQTITVTAPGWNVENSGRTTKVTKEFTAEDTPYVAGLEIAKITVISNLAQVKVTLTGIGADSGNAYQASGSCMLRWQNNSWVAIEAMQLKWSDLKNMTWSQLEAIGKPQTEKT